MSERQIVIAIDAMGGENSPFKVLKGTEIFLQNEKGVFYFAKKPAKTIKIFDLLNENIPLILDKILWKKSMKWGDFELYWARPLKSILAIFNNKNLIFKYYHLQSSNFTIIDKDFEDRTKTFKNFSWEAELVDISDLDAVRLAVKDPKVRVLFAESLANPDGNISDISALAEIAHEVGIPLVIDNTMATQILCQPGKYGADLVVYSTTKFLSGHGNAMGGCVVDAVNLTGIMVENLKN